MATYNSPSYFTLDLDFLRQHSLHVSASSRPIAIPELVLNILTQLEPAIAKYSGWRVKMLVSCIQASRELSKIAQTDSLWVGHYRVRYRAKSRDECVGDLELLHINVEVSVLTSPPAHKVATRNLRSYNKINQKAIVVVAVPRSTVQAMAETEATTLLANNVDFLNYIIRKLTPADGFRAAGSGGLATTAWTDDQDAARIAQDALVVLKSFDNSSSELRKVDSENPGGNWGGQWDQQRSKLSNDRGLRELTQRMSQEFLDLSDQVTGIHNAFSQFANQKGAAFNQEQEQLQHQIKNLQNRIAVEQSEAAKAQKALDGFLAGITMVGSIFETVFTFGQSNKLMKQAVELLERHTRAAAGEYQRAEALARENSRLYNVRVALSTLTHDVADINGRLGRFANLWAAAHSDAIELMYWVENDYDDELQFLLIKKIEALVSSATVFHADMRRFADVLSAM
ncbi:hypothetical protein CTheo_7022 [Ceratobasidium theobromae]|uniref:Uncharacterized protein n=1 Tax=Ceratobasidium theobromae TaxID=1582974 RepID=A0A5N5QCN4_9AGAM|nr:hypothetical protein CTheo_7022 [Ceratobasidium theobromae]